MALLTEKQIREVSKQAAASPQAVKRLLESTVISFQLSKTALKDFAPEANKQARQYDLGLRLNVKECSFILERSDCLEFLVKILKDYRNNCPHVVNWICRGDFNPRKIPDNVTESRIKHACRTAGRIRASLLRKAGAEL